MKSLLLAFSLLFIQSPQAKDTATLEGFVVKLGTSDPVARARVVLSKDGGGSGSMTATTLGDGKFSFQNVEPGRYHLFTTRDGYVRAEYGQRAPTLPGTVITLAAKQEMKDVRIGLTATGAIAGRIYDKYGDPVGNANVQALKYSYQDGHRVLTIVQSARTNDLGEYRLFWMQPGQYIVSAVPAENMANGNFMTLDLGPGMAGLTGALTSAVRVNVAGAAAAAQGLTSPAETGETYLTVYYPGTTDASGAGAIDLRAGANYTGVDLSVVDARAVRIRGRVVSSRPGPVGASVTLVPRGTLVGNGQLQRTAQVNDQGAFEFKGIAPGAYDLIAASGRQVFTFSDSSTGASGQAVTRQAFVMTTPSGGPPSGQESANDSRLFGRVPIDVNDSDLDNISIPLQPRFNLSGKIALDGPSPGTDATSGMRVLLRPDPLIPQMTSSPAAVSANGTFTITDMVPGDFRVTVSGMPRGGYIKSAVLAGTDASNLLLHIDGEPRGALDVLVGTNPGSLDATVQTEKQEAAPAVTVVLIPNGARRQRAELYRTATSDASGHIHLDGVTPGDYKVFAWENVETGAWQDPDFMRTYEDRGRAVHIGEGSHEMVDVRLIPYR